MSVCSLSHSSASRTPPRTRTSSRQTTTPTMDRNRAHEPFPRAKPFLPSHGYLLVVLPRGLVLLCAAGQVPKPRQTPPIHRRGNHRLRLRPRCPHFFFLFSPFQTQPVHPEPR